MCCLAKQSKKQGNVSLLAMLSFHIGFYNNDGTAMVGQILREKSITSDSAD